MINCVTIIWKLIKEAIIISLVQYLEADFQPQNPKFRINSENFHPLLNTLESSFIGELSSEILKPSFIILI